MIEKDFITYGIHIQKDKFKKIEMKHKSLLNKPDGGLWASCVYLDSWRMWCESENFRVSRLDTWTKFELRPDARILIINSYEDLIRIQEKYPYQSSELPLGKLIDFESIEKDGFDGVYLTENGNLECHDFRYEFTDDSFMTAPNLNSWDVESLVLFNLDHIEIKETAGGYKSSH